MYNAIPSDAEVAFWLVIAVLLLAGLIFFNLFNLMRDAGSDCYIEDVEAWSRNYAKIQHRR